MFVNLLGERVADLALLRTLAESTEGYSGADVLSLAKEAAMRPLRRYWLVDMCDKIQSYDGD